MSTSSEGSGSEQDDLDKAQTYKYLAHLHEHINHTQQHLLGHNPTLVLAPMFFPPSSFWTSGEKEKFFHALSVHSRLRPDLIAEEIGTKSTVDVCLYLDTLEDGFRNHDSIMSSSGLKFVPLLRKDFPIASEISADWVEYEEECAASVTALEPALVSRGVKRGRGSEIATKRNSIRAKRGAARTPDNERDREGEKARKTQFKEWLEQRQAEWDVEDRLECLTDPVLRIIDTVLREDEDSWAISQSFTQGSRQDRMSARPENGSEAIGHQVSIVENSPLPVGDQMIDPSLRCLLPPAPVAESILATTREDDIEPEVSSAPPDGSDQFNRAALPPETFPIPLELTEANEQGQPLTESAVAQLPQSEVPLSPGSRRRLQKRLYMRRKRAEKTGQSVDQTITRLKPGRKLKQRKANIISPEEWARATGEDERETRHPNPSGKTLPYKIRELLDSNAIDAERLRQEGLGLFHMTGLSRLMRTYNELHDISKDVNSQIAGSVIAMLHEQVVDFTSRLVRQTIVSREQEMFAKTQTKAWRLGENQVVTVSNVAHALSLLYEKSYDKHTHFGSLLERLDLDIDPNMSAEAAPEPSASSAMRLAIIEESEGGADGHADGSEPISTGLPLLRIVHPPFVRLPKSLQQASSSDSLHSYLPWTTGLSTDADLDEEDILPSDIAEEELVAELNEEDELDTRDQEKEEVYEQTLWRTFEPSSNDDELVENSGTKRRREADSDDESGSPVKKSKRYKARLNLETCEPQGRVKSVPYVLDSD